MTPEQFCYWLQGYSEMYGKNPTDQQWRQIQDHLQLVFKKVTPNVIMVDDPGMLTIKTCTTC